MNGLTDAEYRKQRRRIEDLAKQWLPRLGLAGWRVNLEYSREPLTSDTAGWSTNARCEAKWEYLSATISFSLPALADCGSEELERIFVHECCHVLVNEMRMWGPSKMEEQLSEEAVKHEERVVCALTLAFLWTRDAAAQVATPKKRKRR